MADEPIVEPIDEPIDTPLELEPQVDDDIKDSFLKGDDKDMQRISSALGRALKQTGNQEKINKSLTDAISALTDKLDTLPEQQLVDQSMVPPQSDSLTQLNQQWQDKILSGDVVGVLDEYSNLTKQAQDNLTKTNKVQVDRLSLALKDQPYYNEIKDEMVNTAYGLVSGGRSPQDAVTHAYVASKANFTEKLLLAMDQQTPGSLQMLKGGSKKQAQPKTSKLTPDVEAAIQRDIDAGVFKDREEWLASASPKLRASWGIT